MQNTILENLDIFACPACRSALKVEGDYLRCVGCDNEYRCEDGIPLLFAPHEQTSSATVTETVKSFYEANPFPNYDDFDSRQSLADKARRGVFACLLDEQIPEGSVVLEAGCGTGQMTNFLGMSWKRRVFGSDLCLNSLRLAESFRSKHGIDNAGFLQMNLFRPAFRDASIDVLVSNGVLHHTSAPYEGFRSLSRLVKPGGFAVIGLYNTLGRLPTDLRRILFNVSGDKFRFLDGHMRVKAYNDARKRAWFYDQYKHPQESKHSYDEVIRWFAACDFDFLFSLPKIGTEPFTRSEQLFVRHSGGTKLTRLLTQLEMLIKGGVDGGLFIMIGQKSMNAKAVNTRENALHVRAHS